MFDKKKTAREICGILEKLVEDAKKLREDDYAEYLAGVKPGETVQPMGLLRSPDSKRELRAVAAAAAARVDAACDAALRDMGDEMAEAPSQDAAAYLASLRGRKRVTRTEMEAAFRNYGGNWSAYRALREIESQQLAEGNDVSCPQSSNTLEGGERFVDEARRASLSFMHYVAREEFRDDADAAARLQFCESMINGFAEDVFGPELFASLGRLAGEGEGGIA